MTTKPVTIRATKLVEEALKQIQNDEFSTYPVIDDNDGFIGFVILNCRHCQGQQVF